MEVLKTFVVDMSPTFAAVAAVFIICVTVARRIAVEQRSKREQQRQQHELNMQNSRVKAIEQQKPVNFDE